MVEKTYKWLEDTEQYFEKNDPVRNLGPKIEDWIIKTNKKYPLLPLALLCAVIYVLAYIIL